MVEAGILLQRAALLLEQGRTADAEAAVRKALEQEPQSAEALALLTRCLFAKRDFDLGLQTIVQAIANNPYNSFYFYLLGYAHYRKDNFEAAIKNLNKAIEISPYAAEYFGLLAYIFIEQKKWQAALEKADVGLAADAENITCLNARSIALNKLNRTAEAIETMQGALAQDPDNEATHTTIGWNLVEKGKHREAVTHFREALRLDPNQAAAKAGLKEALKSKLAIYRWLLQYSFWVNNRGRTMRFALPIALYIVFKILISLTASGEYTVYFSLFLVGLYLTLIVITWTINAIANFVLLFHATGKYALSVSEKWSGICVVAALITGLALLTFSFAHTAATETMQGSIFIAGLVSLSLALPLGQLQFPLSLRDKRWRVLYTKALCAVGLLVLILLPVMPAFGTAIAVGYGVAFLIYNWSGAFR